MKSIRIAVLAGAIATGAAGAAFATAAQQTGAAAGTQEPAHAHGAQKPDQGAMAACQAMMEKHKKMMADVQQADASLKQAVSAMNAASGEARVDAIAKTVTLLVDQRAQMHERMMGMHMEMMGHMGDHMARDPKGMMACPMMKSMSHGGEMKPPPAQ